MRSCAPGQHSTEVGPSPCCRAGTMICHLNPMNVTLQLSLALAGGLVLATANLPCAAADNRTLTMSVARRDLRPLEGVTLRLTGAVNVQGVTDNNGRVAFLDLPPAGAIVVAPSRSGFRLEPPQL